jgi:hypothetical protein
VKEALKETHFFPFFCASGILEIVKDVRRNGFCSFVVFVRGDFRSKAASEAPAERVCVLFIGTQFSILYTDSMSTRQLEVRPTELA